MTITEAAKAIFDEYHRARLLYRPFNSAHEAYAVLLEEVDELWREVKAKDRNLSSVQEEATQVGAMALAILVEVCHD